MKQYDFDKIVDRHNTGAYKYDGLQDNFGRTDVIPLWVADMDFETPDFIMDALKKRLEHPVLGYPKDHPDYWPSVIDWIDDHHGYRPEREWLTYIPGIVKGIGFAINCFTEPGDKIIIQPPVYHPFRLVTEHNSRQVVNNPLKETADGSYEMDLEHLRKVAPGAKMLILSNPHNPAGVVWPKETLQEVAKIAKENNLIVISDEIHCDMALFGHKHHVFTSVSPEAEEVGIVFGAPTKTFNIAGIVSSYAMVPNRQLRERFFGWLGASEFNEANIFAPIATQAAFRHGENWRQQMIAYIEGNVRFVEEFCRENMPEIKPWRPQASFLIWLDCRKLGLSQEELNSLLLDKAHIALNDGSMFGAEGTGFMRLNIGCPRSVLSTALTRLSNVTKGTRPLL